MILFLTPLTHFVPCRTLLSIRNVFIATKLHEIFFSDCPSGVGTGGFFLLDFTWLMLSTGSYSDFICNTVTSWLWQISIHQLKVRSQILRSFLVVCSSLISSTMQSWVRLSCNHSLFRLFSLLLHCCSILSLSFLLY